MGTLCHKVVCSFIEVMRQVGKLIEWSIATRSRHVNLHVFYSVCRKECNLHTALAFFSSLPNTTSNTCSRIQANFCPRSRPDMRTQFCTQDFFLRGCEWHNITERAWCAFAKSRCVKEKVPALRGIAQVQSPDAFSRFAPWLIQHFILVSSGTLNCSEWRVTGELLSE